jgi:hypothetical protein
MDVSVQDAIQDLITALIRSLGPTHGKLLTLLRTFPPGAETLALRVLTIFTENGRPNATLVALVKSLITERDLDARFLIPIIAEMDKVPSFAFHQEARLNATFRRIFSVISPVLYLCSMDNRIPRILSGLSLERL